MPIKGEGLPVIFHVRWNAKLIECAGLLSSRGGVIQIVRCQTIESGDVLPLPEAIEIPESRRSPLPEPRRRAGLTDR